MLLLVCVVGLFYTFVAWLLSNESAEFAIASAPSATMEVRSTPISAPKTPVAESAEPPPKPEPAPPAEPLRGLTKFQRRLIVHSC